MSFPLTHQVNGLDSRIKLILSSVSLTNFIENISETFENFNTKYNKINYVRIGCNFCWYHGGYSGFSWLVLLFLGICDLPTLVRMAHALSRTKLRKNVSKWTILLFTSVYSVLLIDSFTSVDNIDYNITLTFPSAFVPTLMIMVPL